MTLKDSTLGSTPRRRRGGAVVAKREPRLIVIPPRSLVLLIGPSGCGKSTFARQYFRSTEVLSSDHCRALLADDENDMTVTRDAFDLLHSIADRRLARGRLTVVDATNVQARARKPLLALAVEYRRPAVAIVFDLPQEVCLERNRLRTDRHIPPGAIRRQQEQLHESLPGLRREGLRHIYILRTTEEVDAARVGSPKV